MKVRHGFVSNSSSTSFCIVGVCLNDKSLDEKRCEEFRKRLVEEGYNEDECGNFEVGELVDNAYNVMYGEEFDKQFADLVVFHGLSEYSSETYFIGKEICNMKDEETLGAFKDSVYEALKKFGYINERKQVRIFIDGGYE